MNTRPGRVAALIALAGAAISLGAGPQAARPVTFRTFRGPESFLVSNIDGLKVAAARVNTLGAAEILKRLPQRFRILRQRGTTLQGAIMLSWEMLDDFERELLGQCVVFRGGLPIVR